MHNCQSCHPRSYCCCLPLSRPGFHCFRSSCSLPATEPEEEKSILHSAGRRLQHQRRVCRVRFMCVAACRASKWSDQSKAAYKKLLSVFAVRKSRSPSNTNRTTLPYAILQPDSITNSSELLALLLLLILVCCSLPAKICKRTRRSAADRLLPLWSQLCRDSRIF